VLTDVPGPSGSLATMTWITPDLADSDHPGSLSTTGPQWVASVIDGHLRVMGRLGRMVRSCLAAAT
jgi:hypothetical protein